jgi:hypothetical protein
VLRDIYYCEKAWIVKKEKEIKIKSVEFILKNLKHRVNKKYENNKMS